MSLHLFKFKEAIAPNYLSALPAYFNISTRTSYDVLILRLLTSTINIESVKKSKTIALQDNLGSFPSHPVSRKSARPIRALFTPLTLDDYTIFSKRYYSKNINFYNNILQELTYFFYYTNEGHHQSAFVNLYRILEYLSYCFPLMHSSHFGSYFGSFEALRSYFTDPKTSETKFFEKFVEKLFRGTSYLSLTTDFEFMTSDPVIGTNCYRAFHSLMQPTDWIIADQATLKLSIENKNMIQLFKNARNKYFHFAVGGHRNIQIIDLKDPDFFFEKINIGFMNWIGFIYTTVIKESVDNSKR